MDARSITSAEAFIARAQLSEATRVALWIVVLLVMVVLTVSRRLSRGVVMSRDEGFYPYVGLLILALLAQAVLFRLLRRANRGGVLLPGWLWKASGLFDLAVVVAILVIAAFWSPRG